MFKANTTRRASLSVNSSNAWFHQSYSGPTLYELHRYLFRIWARQLCQYQDGRVVKALDLSSNGRVVRVGSNPTPGNEFPLNSLVSLSPFLVKRTEQYSLHDPIQLFSVLSTAKNSFVTGISIYQDGLQRFAFLKIHDSYF